MLVKDFIETRPNGEIWFDIHSDTKGKAVLQVSTGNIYSGIAMRMDDPNEYQEVDDPNYVPEVELPEEFNLEGEAENVSED